MQTPAQEEVPPSAATLIEGMRDIGYSFKTAVADIIDNSISAGAREISVLADFVCAEPHVAFFDDGVGMSMEELREAMRPGTKGPLASRGSKDLGRFGLGLKTASFSQCRRLSVATRSCGGSLNSRAWDIDTVVAQNRWIVEIPEGGLLEQLASRIGRQGTVVLWQNLDRLQEEDADAANRAIDEVRSHLSLVFHRYLQRRGAERVVLTVNGLVVEPVDPFCEGHPATLAHEEQVLSFDGGKVTVRGFTIPHHSKMSADDYARAGLDGGHARNQGFYIYRRERLIMHGGWLGLERPSAARQLSRVRVDVPTEMDSDWRVDIKKSSTQLPSHVRRELSKVIDKLGIGSKRTYEFKGRMRPIHAEWGLWCRIDRGDSITYTVNCEHPAVCRLRESMDSNQRKMLDHALALFAASLPIDSIFNDLAQRPTNIRLARLDDGHLRSAVEDVAGKLLAQGMGDEEVRALITALPQFSEFVDVVTQVVSQLKEKEI
jgi:hypothetical protein